MCYLKFIKFYYYLNPICNLPRGVKLEYIIASTL